MNSKEYEIEKSLNLIFQQLEILKQKFIEERKGIKTYLTKGPGSQRMLYDLMKENFRYNNPQFSETEIDEEFMHEVQMLQLVDISEKLRLYDEDIYRK